MLILLSGRKRSCSYEKYGTAYQSVFTWLLVFQSQFGIVCASLCNHASNCARALLAPLSHAAAYYLVLELGDWLVAISNCESFTRISGGFFGIS